MAWSYAVIRINVDATLEGFEYPDILVAARTLRPKTYLVFLENVSSQLLHRCITLMPQPRPKELALPFPNDPCYPYSITPVTPCPPPVAEGFAAEMCVPIFPNTHHPNGREPVRTDREFPYNNCYHWSMAQEVNVRVRAKAGEFDDGIAVHLPPRAMMKLWDMMGSDRIIAEGACEKGESAGEDARPRRSRSTSNAAGPSETDLAGAADHVDATTLLEKDIRHRDEIPTNPSREDTEAEPSMSEGLTHSGDASESRSLSTRSDAREASLHSAASEFRAIVATGIFGLTNEERKFWPMVDLWLELADHLEQEDIPDPHDLYREYDALAK